MSWVLDAKFVDRRYHLTKNTFSIVRVVQLLDIEDIDWYPSIGARLTQGGNIKSVALQPLFLLLKLKAKYRSDEAFVILVGEVVAE